MLDAPQYNSLEGIFDLMGGGKCPSEKKHSKNIVNTAKKNTMQKTTDRAIVPENPDSPQNIEQVFYRYSLDLMAIVGADGFFKKVNPAFESVLGYTDEEMFARPVVSFLHPDDVARTKTGINILAQGTKRLHSRNRYLCKDGSYRWLSWHSNPIGHDFYTIGRDITEQVEAEEKVRELNRQLEEHNRDLEKKVQERIAELQKMEAQVTQLQKMDAVGRLAGGVAHDFNNMLAAITMACDLLSDDISDTQAATEHVRSIREVAEKAAALTRQLLLFSREQHVTTQVIDLNSLIRELERMLVRLIGENMQIVLNLANDLKNVCADTIQLEQVILNLVVNARDAMPKGGKITIETSNVFLDEAFTSTHLSVERGHYVLLAVSDQGVGMDAETIGKIFEPFFTTKAIGKGTGLGLSTTYGIVKKCNGSIWVYSEPGHGTVFKIYLPVTETNVTQPTKETTTAAVASQARTILLVEDDKNLRKIFSMILARKGYELLIAESGKDALTFCHSQAGKIDLMLTDVMMPDCNGFELASQAEKLQPGLRVLFMSGYTDQGLQNSGMTGDKPMDFIQKPFDVNALVAKIESVLNR